MRRWKPEPYETYFVIDMCQGAFVVSPCEFLNDNHDHNFLLNKNGFRTRKEAMSMLRKIKLLLRGEK